MISDGYHSDHNTSTMASHRHQMNFIILFGLAVLLTPCKCQSEASVTDSVQQQQPETTPAAGQPEQPPDEGNAPSEETAEGAAQDLCGGNVEGTSGVIEYKMYTPYDSNERCVWSVHSAGSLRIKFSLESNGLIQTTQDYISIGYFVDADYKSANSYKEVILKHNSVNRTATVPGEVAFVRFISDKTMHGLGFRIRYESEMAEYTYPHHYQTWHYPSDYGMVQYVQSKQYPSERLAIVIKPNTTITLALKYLISDCGKSRDYLTMYQRRNSYDRSALQSMQQLCTSPMDKLPTWKVNSDAEIFITFQTNSSRWTEQADADYYSSLGFEFVWVPST